MRTPLPPTHGQSKMCLLVPLDHSSIQRRAEGPGNVGGKGVYMKGGTFSKWNVFRLQLDIPCRQFIQNDPGRQIGIERHFIRVFEIELYEQTFEEPLDNVSM